MPNLEELCIKDHFEQALRLPGVKDFIPDHWSVDSHRLERKWFWKLMTALYPDFVRGLVDNVKHQRRERKKDRKEEEKPTIYIAAHWQAKIEALNLEYSKSHSHF